MPTLAPAASMALRIEGHCITKDLWHEELNDIWRLPLLIKNRRGHCTWAKALGLECWSQLPRNNVLKEICDYLESLRGKATRKCKRVNGDGDVQDIVMDCKIRLPQDRATPVRVLNETWPVHLEAIVENVTWILSELHTDLQNEDNPKWMRSSTSDADPAHDVQAGSIMDSQPHKVCTPIGNEVPFAPPHPFALEPPLLTSTTQS